MLCFVFLLSTLCFSAQADFFSDDSTFTADFQNTTSSADENISLLFDIGPTMESYLQESAGIKKNIDPFVILSILNSLDIMGVLRAPFFLQTRMLGQKNILDRPLGDSLTIIQKPKTMVYMPTIFAEKLMTDEDFFSNYFATQQTAFFDALENSFEKAKELLPFDPLQALDLEKIFSFLNQITVEQRMAGATLLASWAEETFCVRALCAIKYIERNFFLPEETLEDFLLALGVPPSQDDTFSKNHLISDQAGIADVRIEFEMQGTKGLTNSFNYGAFIDVPAAFAVKRGIAGTFFPQRSTLPPFDFDLLFALILDPTAENKEKASNFLTQFALDALDRISANLLHTDMGIFPHVGIGVFMRTKTRLSHFLPSPWWTHRCIMKNHLSLEYFTPGREHIFYTTKIDQAEFDQFPLEAILESGDRERAEEAINFIERKIVETFFLRSFSTLIQPGFVFRWASAFLFMITKHSRVTIGSEFFYKNKDHILRVSAPHDVKQTLDFEKAPRKQMRETTLFAKYTHKKVTTSGILIDFFIGLQATASMEENVLTGYEMSIGWKVEF